VSETSNIDRLLAALEATFLRAEEEGRTVTFKELAEICARLRK
jgi:DNA-binding Xre family transcriptional regulator